MFKNFTIANFLDDPSYDQGQYGYPEIKANAAVTRSITEFPANGSGTVNPYAADFLDVSGSQGSLNVEFTGTDGEFYLTLVGYDRSGEVKKMTERIKP